LAEGPPPPPLLFRDRSIANDRKEVNVDQQKTKGVGLSLEQAAQVLDTLAASVAWLQERATTAGWPVPDAPEELAAWALDEMAIQIEQARDHPREANDRLPFAAEMAFLAAALLWNGALPVALPWEQSID
jgi:hypothetical protein